MIDRVEKQRVMYLLRRVAAERVSFSPNFSTRAGALEAKRKAKAEAAETALRY